MSSSSISASERERLRNLGSICRFWGGGSAVDVGSFLPVGIWLLMLLLLCTDKSVVVSSIQFGMNGLFLMFLVSCSSCKTVGGGVVASRAGHELGVLLAATLDSKSFSGIENESFANGLVQDLGPVEISAAALDKLMGISVPAGLENWRRATGRGMTEL